MTASTARAPLANYQLNYRGDLRGRVEGQLVGPNRMGEVFVIVATEFDAEADRTTARVAFPAQEDLAREIGWDAKAVRDA